MNCKWYYLKGEEQQLSQEGENHVEWLHCANCEVWWRIQHIVQYPRSMIYLKFSSWNSQEPGLFIWVHASSNFVHTVQRLITPPFPDAESQVPFCHTVSLLFCQTPPLSGHKYSRLGLNTLGYRPDNNDLTMPLAISNDTSNQAKKSNFYFSSLASNMVCSCNISVHFTWRQNYILR